MGNSHAHHEHVLILIPGDGHGARVCYALWICLLYATCPGIYAIIAAEVNQAFGPVHYQANFQSMACFYEDLHLSTSLF